MPPPSTSAPIRPCPRPWATFAVSVAAMPRPSSHRASHGTGTVRRTESCTTVELAQIRPSTINGMRWAVHSVSPCVY
jgi:hypothetical protein